MSWDDYLKFVEANPKYTLSLDTGMPIKGRPNAEMPKMVPPADPFAPMMSKAEDIVARARGAGSEAKKFLTEPQRLPHPVTGLPYQTKDPVTGKLGGYAMGFTPAQTAARVGLPTAGAAGAGYLGLQGAESRRARDAAAVDAEVGARQAEELRMQQDAAADQSAFRRAPNALPFFATGEEDRMKQRAADLQPVTPGLLAMAGRGMGQGAAPSYNQPAAGGMPLISRLSPESLRFSVNKARDAAPLRPSPAPAAAAAAAPAADQGILSKIFGGDPYKDMSSAKLMEQANRGDDAAAFFRADTALRRERPEMFERKAEEGMATGGAAKPHKDAALHKALEIIHHLISRR
jgi:hypothetical protein